jgi:hypothetical protein
LKELPLVALAVAAAPSIPAKKIRKLSGSAAGNPRLLFFRPWVDLEDYRPSIFASHNLKEHAIYARAPDNRRVGTSPVILFCRKCDLTLNDIVRI